MDKIRNLSIRKTILLYMTVNLFVCFLLNAFIVQMALATQGQIWMKYVDEEVYYEALESQQAGYQLTIERPPHRVMSAGDIRVSELCDFLETYAILLLSSGGSILVVLLFYHNKIKPPLAELRRASALIAREELGFRVTYENKDELGQLCRAFEHMRGQLEENNQKLWKLIEQDKVLRAAVAHDIRSPLAIIKGYQEMLLEFVPGDELDKDKIVEMLEAGMQQIERLERFTGMIKELSHLEGRELRIRPVELPAFMKTLQKSAEILSAGTGKEVMFEFDSEGECACFDSFAAAEVMENLLLNALRFAHKKVWIDIVSRNDVLCISVGDDGKGFDSSEKESIEPFYYANSMDDTSHFGLGLYISRVCCEKHGGTLETGNQAEGGGIVKASFRCGENVQVLS